MTLAERIERMKKRQELFLIQYDTDIKAAICSLEAWEKVLDELREYGSICVEYTAEDDKVDAIVDSVLKQAKQAVLEIIDKHLAGVTQNEQKHDGNNERN